MPNLPKLARLDMLAHSLENAVTTIRDLAASKALERLAAGDPDRWNIVMDSLSAAMEPGEMGSVLQVHIALGEAMKD